MTNVFLILNEFDMRNILIFIFLINFGIAQSQVVGVTREISSEYYPVPGSIIFEKSTGNTLSYDKYQTMMMGNPNMRYEPKDEDLDGVPISYYVYLQKSGNSSQAESIKEIPKIERHDLDGNIVKWPNFSRKKALIILQLDLQLPMINVEGIKEAEDSALEDAGISSLIITRTDQETSRNFVKAQGLKSMIIPNAFYLINKFEVRRYPAFFLVDSDGTILDSTVFYDEVGEMLKK